MHFISVVIPMYNSKDTIIATLDSVKSQTALRYIHEVFVVNDGSKDNSSSLVEEYIERNKSINIRLINKINGGVSSARNTGMKAATGDWIALLDSDDIWLPNKIQLQVDTICQNSDIDFLGGDLYDDQKIFFRRLKGLYKASVRDVCLENFPQPSTAIFKKRIFDEIGGFDEKQRYAEDGNYFLKICAWYNYYHLPVKVVDYGGGKQGFGQIGLSANLEGMYEGNVKNIRELREAKIISSGFFIFLRLFYWVKYLRRILITKVGKIKAGSAQ